MSKNNVFHLDEVIVTQRETMTSHSYQEMIEAMVSTIDDWPRYSNGKKKPNNGLLPLEHHPSPSWLTKVTEPVVMPVSCSQKPRNRKRTVVDAPNWMQRE
jgi:hypothetical protein